jgi:hypothetical protein
MYTKETFWDNTQGVFIVLAEGKFDELIKKYKGKSDNCNFNPDKTSYFIRMDSFAIRISDRWGLVGNDEERCKWTLNKPNEGYEGYVAAVIEYKRLKPYFKK